MSERMGGYNLGGGTGQSFKRWVADAIPDWQVFVRRPDGSSTHFAVSRSRQLLVLGGAVALSLWAGLSVGLLAHRPTQLAEERAELQDLLASNRASQQNLASAEQMVGDITHEVDSVYANLVALAETSETLSKDLPRGKNAASISLRPRMAVAAGTDAPSQPEALAMHQQVRQLEESLDRLRLAYARAVQQTADAADSRITAAEQQLARLGLDPARLLNQRRSAGQGGPFIPVEGAAAVAAELSPLMDRVQYWNGIRASLQRLPLAVPVHGGFEFNSGFGARNDPLNNRTGMHEGVDLGAPAGTPVYATAEGVVTLASMWDRYGNTVEINHGNGVSTRYAHLSQFKVREGQKVGRDTLIGLVGTTGRSTGPHLHYEVRVGEIPRDPIKFISAGRDVLQVR